MATTLYHGTESFLMHDAVQAAIASARTKGVEVTVIDGSLLEDPEQGWTLLAEATAAQSLFATKRLIIARDLPFPGVTKRKKKAPAKTKKPAKPTKAKTAEPKVDPREQNIINIISRASTDVIIVTDQEQIAPAIAAACAKVQAFEPLAPAVLAKWFQQRAAEQGFQLTPPVASSIMQRVGVDMWRLAQVIDTLAALGRTPTLQDLDRLVTANETFGRFDVIDAVARKDLGNLLAAIGRARRNGEESISILNTLLYQIRVLLSVADGAERGMSDEAMATAFALHPFVIKKARTSVRAWSMTELQLWFDRLANLEWSIKAQVIDPEIGLDLLLTSLLQPRSRAPVGTSSGRRYSS